MIQPIIAPSELVEQAASWSQADGQIVPIYADSYELLQGKHCMSGKCAVRGEEV